MNAKSKKMGLIGRNISYSLSAKIHNYAIEKFGLSEDYKLIEVENTTELAQCIYELTESGGSGFNITQPYKAEAAKLFGENEPINCVYKKNGRYFGTSTDGLGFARSLLHLGSSPNDFDKVIVFGNGSTALSIAVFFLNQTKTSQSFFFIRRNEARDPIFQNLFASHGKVCQLLDWSSEAFQSTLEKNPQEKTLIIQASSLRDADEFLIFEKILSKKFNVQALVDVNYNLKNPAFYRSCKELNIPYQDGFAFLIEQALACQMLWWGKKLEFNDVKSLLLIS
ncbi:MAG: hypothetical protein KBD78_02175 [Oligoflexales bacterium]|nr:hypothetical protein [Oligoflexales bacterium]